MFSGISNGWPFLETVRHEMKEQFQNIIYKECLDGIASKIRSPIDWNDSQLEKILVVYSF